MTFLAMHPPPRSGPAAFVAAHQRGLLRWLAALGCEPQAAEEHCQDALLAGLHHGVDADEPAVAWRWLRTTARNLYFMHLRRARRRPEVAWADVEAGWQAMQGDRDGGDGALAALRACLERIPPRDREMLERRYRDDASRADLAARVGIGEAGVKQALRRARERVQRCVEARLRQEKEA